jgi:hypothetical protein
MYRLGRAQRANVSFHEIDDYIDYNDYGANEKCSQSGKGLQPTN